jgi:outer membrane protein assembly factor BamB
MSPKPRLWPGVAAAILQWLLMLVLPLINPEWLFYGMLAGLVFGLVILVWWAFFSRIPRLERWGGLAVAIAATFAVHPILERSISTAMMGFMYWVYVIPAITLALVVWAVIAARLAPATRRVALLAAILIACGAFTLLRTEGITGFGRSQLAWRWTKTHEQLLLAQTAAEPAPPSPAPSAAETPKQAETPAAAAPAAPQPEPAASSAPTAETAPAPVAAQSRIDWPGFRGPHRDSVVPGIRINTDWAQSPPTELWRRPVGPGWSSFAVQGDRVYTQEQRGDSEVVTCYSLSDGKPVWTHSDAARFWESNGGAGPRGTPTLANGRVYSFGATGILNALDARTGKRIWTRNPASENNVKVPGWGFSSSPLVVDNVVIIAAAGQLAAYSAADGTPRWVGPNDGSSYSSPQLLEIGNVPQIVMMGHGGATSVAPADGKVLWKYGWAGIPILQPVISPDGAVILTQGDENGGGAGTRRVNVAQSSDGWKAEEVWASSGLKPYFNDLVVHNGHAFGFDGSILSCIDLRDGKRKWKGGRYGNGQMLLLADQDVLLVLSEEGEVALVSAGTDKFNEIAKRPAIEGKTWNHPALAGDILLVRNDREMAAFRLKLAGT